MRIKPLVYAMSYLLVLGIGGNVFAFSDSTGEEGTSGVDIISASVVTSNQILSNPPDTAHLGVKMAPDSHLPAAIVFDFDADNDTATGGGSMITGIPTKPCGDQPCKADVGGGFDFSLALILRNQDDTSAWSNASSCVEESNQCATRGTLHDCGVEGTCYELASSCIDGPDCYLVSDRCDTGCPGLFVYPMTTLCTDASSTPPCDRGYVKGEWNVFFGPSTGRVINGITNLGLTYSVTNETEICIEVPWGIILAEAWIRITDAEDPAHLPFDYAYTQVSPPKFQVTALHNLRYNAATDKQDFLQPKLPAEPPGLYIAFKDWVPDTARVADGEFNPNAPCTHNSDGGFADEDVDAADVADFLNEFGRSTFFLPCPTCVN